MARRRMLADELGDLLNPAPRHEPDPDALAFEDRGAAGAAGDADAQLEAQLADAAAPRRRSQLRMRAAGVALEGAAYRGRPSSRAALFGGGDDDDEEDGSSDDEEEEEGEDGGSSGGGEGVSSDEEAGGLANGHPHRSSSDGGDDDNEDDDDGASGDDGEEEEEDDDDDDDEGRAAIARFAGGEGDAEMAELERQHAALREQAGAVDAARVQRAQREAAKAKAVRAQRAIWERALEARILLQRPVSAAMRLPRREARATVVAASAEAAGAYERLLGAAAGALRELLALHDALIERHPQASAAAAVARREGGVDAGAAAGASADAGAGSKRSRHAAGLGGGGDGDGGAPPATADACWRAVERSVAAAAPFRDGALDKWHRRTVLASGTAALRGGGGLRALQQSVTVQVRSLMRDGARLVARTQLPASVAPRPLFSAGGDAADRSDAGADANAAAADARDPETYDDGEFYHQMLRELLEAGGGAGGNDLGAASLAAARPAKRRKLVDRRASKGRRLRFHVMDKLVGFCAPTRLEPPPFAAQLFNNLFGAAGGGGANANNANGLGAEGDAPAAAV